ncbi:hypothetical protein [Methylocaldum sp.]|uniref:hypothetical protein n=1 Tax=Methylocaldum sp. TaxID=1969727 RepID=UPI002D570A64|nr:hypothetical protein [Methylocaldum sp.]HYE38204.1 hypothetical protein [Methylocaldum sp.]
MSSIMEQAMSDFLPRDRQTLVQVIQGWVRGSAKEVARAWGVDPATAENVRKGVVSTKTLQRAMAAEGWPLVLALGHAATGKSYEEWLEDELTKARSGAARLEALAERSRIARGQDPRPDPAGSQRSFAPMDRRGSGERRSVGVRDA